MLVPYFIFGPYSNAKNTPRKAKPAAKPEAEPAAKPAAKRASKPAAKKDTSWAAKEREGIAVQRMAAGIRSGLETAAKMDKAKAKEREGIAAQRAKRAKRGAPVVDKGTKAEKGGLARRVASMFKGSGGADSYKKFMGS